MDASSGTSRTKTRRRRQYLRNNKEGQETENWHFVSDIEAKQFLQTVTLLPMNVIRLATGRDKIPKKNRQLRLHMLVLPMLRLPAVARIWKSEMGNSRG